jgi:hypothetical protein
MKSLILAVALTFTLPVFAAPETKRVCITQKDAKTGKEKEVCKNIKVHKKLDGTPVPDPKKK